MNTKMKMKIAAMTACAMIATGASIKPVYAGGRMDINGTKEEQLNFWEAIVKETKEEKFFVKLASGFEINEEMLLTCAKTKLNSKGENEIWRNANEAERKQLLEQARKIISSYLQKYDQIGVMRSGLITKSYFYTFAPKGTIKVGDQIIAKIIPESEHPFRECPSWKGQLYYAGGIERVIKRSESKSESGSGSGNAFKSSFLN